MPIAKIYPQGFYRNLFHIFYLYFIFYAFLKLIHISKILKPEKEFEKKMGTVLGWVSAQGFGSARKVGRSAHACGATCACPRAVTAHCRRAVARPVRCTGDLLGDKILTLMTGELRGDGWAR
jgi:hypothetical protein